MDIVGLFPLVENFDTVMSWWNTIVGTPPIPLVILAWNHLWLNHDVTHYVPFSIAVVIILDNFMVLLEFP